jgi:hypothetical protein
MPADATELLLRLAQKYVWWKTPHESLPWPQRIIAQVMDIGEFEDVRQLTEMLGDDQLRDVLAHAEPGQFREQSWEYWHYRLGMAASESMPMMPRRTFA